MIALPLATTTQPMKPAQEDHSDQHEEPRLVVAIDGEQVDIAPGDLAQRIFGRN